MYCPKCGFENVEGAQLCNGCSCVLTDVSAVEAGCEAKMSGLAVTALVLGILSLCSFFITALPAIICGIIGLVKISKSEGRLKGKGLAIAGIVIPVVLLIMTSTMLPAFHGAREKVEQLICTSNMHQLSIAMITYADDYGGKFPPSDQWCDLLTSYAGGNERIFNCNPAESGGFSYGFNKNLDGLTTADISPQTVMLFEIEGGRNIAGGAELLYAQRHQDEGCNIVFADGHVEFVKSERFGDLDWGSEKAVEEKGEIIYGE